jgi:hypothetical protein
MKSKRLMGGGVIEILMRTFVEDEDLIDYVFFINQL